MTLIKYEGFTVDYTASTLAGKFPMLVGKAYSFLIDINSTSYNIFVSFGIGTGQLYYSIYNTLTNAYVLRNVPIQNGVDLLFQKTFEGYSMIFNDTQCRFEFYSED